MAKKRNWSKYNEDNVEYVEPLLSQVLPVANLPDDFNGEPLDGMQYLFTVRRDSRKLPNTTRVPNPYEVKDKPPEFVVGSSNLKKSAIPLPSEEWRDIFVQRFKNFRKNSQQATVHVDLPINPNQKQIPDRKLRDEWWAFLSGRPEYDWNPPKKPKTISAKAQKRQGSYHHGQGMRAFGEEDDAYATVDSRETWQVNNEGEVELVSSESVVDSSVGRVEVAGVDVVVSAASTSTSTEQIGYKEREPTPALLRHIDHRYAMHLLMYFNHWISLHLEQPFPQSSHMSETHARWIFALLSRVEDHISADEASLLRNLARSCIALLKQHVEHPPTSPSDESPSPSMSTRMSDRSCWIILTAIIGTWAQRDLWMDAETALASIESR
ncbi:hypothetical protein ABKN59_005782 [Abortiporus biennis]